MPLNAISVLVVVHCQAGLVVELLQPLDGDPDVVVGLYGALLDTLVIVRLGFSCSEIMSRFISELKKRLLQKILGVFKTGSHRLELQIMAQQLSIFSGYLY